MHEKQLEQCQYEGSPDSTRALYLPLGMSSWVVGGWESVLAAEEESEKMKSRKTFLWTSEVSSSRKGKK